MKTLNKNFKLLALLLLLGLTMACSSDDDSMNTDDEQQTEDNGDQTSNLIACVIWQENLGGNLSDWLYDMVPTTDGGYLLTGGSNSNTSGDKSEESRGEFDIWVVKIDALGNKIWDKTLGGSQDDIAFSVAETQDGGAIVGGYSKSSESEDKSEASLGGEDIWIIRLSSGGSVIWENTIGGSNFDFMRGIVATADGGFVVGAHSLSESSEDKSEDTIGLGNALDYWIFKLSADGDILWDNTIGGSSGEYLDELKATADGGFILSGTSSSEVGFDKSEPTIGLEDIWIVKVNSTGQVVWDKTIGGNANDAARDIIQTADGGYLIGGFTNSEISGDVTESPIGDRDYWAIKLSASGDLQWQNVIGGLNKDEANAVVQKADGNYLVAGNSRSGASGDKTEASQGNIDYWIVELDPSGNLVDQRSLGGFGQDQLFTMVNNGTGGFVVGGFSSSEITGDNRVGNNGASDFWLLSLSCVSDD